jgi:hypothetical protein
VEKVVNLSSAKYGEKGEVRLRLVFNPMIVAKSRKHTSTFSNATRTMTNIGTLPLSAGMGVFHGVTGVFKHKEHEEMSPASPSNLSPRAIPGLGALHGVTGVFKHKEPEESTLVSPSDQSPHAAEVSDNHVPVATNTNSSQSGQSAAGEPGTLRVSVLDAKGLVPHDIKPYTTVRVGDKEFKTKHTGKTDTPEWLVILYHGFNL